MSENLRHYGAEYGGIALQKLQPALTRLLVDAGGDYYGGTPGQIGITAACHLQRVGKWDGMVDIVGLGAASGFILVNQHDLATDALHHHGVSRSRPDKTASDNTDFHIISLSDASPPLVNAATRFMLSLQLTIVMTGLNDEIG
jgi:hypothetical protein